MKNKTPIILFVFTLTIFSLCVNVTAAESSPYNKLFLTPFYKASMTNNVNSSYTLSIGANKNEIINIKSAILSFDIYITPTVTFNLWVNNKQCVNPSYTISTTFSGAGQGRITFDCSNVIKKAGTYNVIIKPVGANTGAVTGWVDISYSSSPAGDMTIHGTEYTYSRDLTAKVWLQLLSANGTYINNAVCYADIYTPTGDYYLEESAMTNMAHDGIYYLDLPVPSSQFGVFPAIARCYYEAGQIPYYPANYRVINGTYTSGSVADLQVQDGTFMRFTERVSGAQRRVAVSFNITQPYCLNISELLLTGLTVSTYARFDSVPNDVISISIYNYTSSRWIPFPNKILEGPAWNSASNSISTINLTKSYGVTTTNPIQILLNDTNLADINDNNLDLDYLSVSCDALANPEWQEVKGSSELHVTSISDTPFYVETLCGSSETNEDTSACSQFKNNLSISNTVWGYVWENLYFINNQQSTVNSTYYYETPFSQDCTGLLEVNKIENGTVTSIYDDVTLQHGTRDNCIIGVPVEFTSSQREFNVEIFMENYMVWEGQRDNDYVKYFDLVITPLCNQVAQANGISYVLPVSADLDVSSLYSGNPVLLGCYRTMDDLYWFNYYFTESQAINTSGEYESYLYNFKLYYPEIKDEASISMGINLDNTLIHAESLCGDGTGTTMDYGCALLKSPDSYFTSQEGYILENITVYNDFNSSIDGYVTYATAGGVDCSAVLKVEKQNGVLTDITNDISYSAAGDNCVMKIPINNVNGQTKYNILIYMENYLLWDIYWARDKVNQWSDIVQPYCNGVASNASVSYSLPINSSIEAYRNNTELYFCYRAMDDIYWWNFFYDLLSTEGYTTIGEIESVHYESEFFWVRILDETNTIRTFQRNTNQIQMLADLQDLRLNTANRVWNYTDRQLTAFNYTIGEINNTAIAESVWNYTGTISINILNQITSAIDAGIDFAQEVWNYFARYTHGEEVA